MSYNPTGSVYFDADTRKGMICKECGSKMYLDDKDFNFKGNFDNYWCCEKCQTSCIEQVRFARPFKELWHSENDGVKDYVIRCQRIGG